MSQFIQLPGAAIEHLPAALMHSLWQGLLVTLLVFLLLRRIPVTRPDLRYGAAVAGLLGVVLALLLTWSVPEHPLKAKNAPAVAASSPAPVSASAVEHSAEAAAPRSRSFQTPTPSASGYLLRVWLAGAALMLLRVLRLMRGTRSLRRRCRVLDDPLICELLDNIKTVMGISRRVAVLVADGLASPVAMGLIWPAVALPASMVTGLSPDQLRAVLAHELAHIRRYDYLVNFIQLVIEAVLYFNPAVWWLSRQIRIEREACCDVLAARVTGGVVDYAAALAQVARGLQQPPLPTLAQAFGAERGPGGLLDRTRRLLLPGYWPKLRLRWYSLALGMLITLAMLLGLFQSSVMSVAFMGWLLSDKERIEVMSQLAQQYNPASAPEDYDRLEDVEVSGVLTTTDGKSLPSAKGSTYLHSVSATTSAHSICYASGCLELDGNHFHGTLKRGDLYVFAEFPGYAPTSVGPLRGDAQHPVEGVEIRLEPCQPATIRFVDVNGAPIAGAQVEGFYRFLPNTGFWTLHLHSDERGRVQIDQARNPVPIQLEVKAAGYQYARNQQLIVKASETFDWMLQPDEPLDVFIVDKTNGAPIVGAEVALAYERSRDFPNNGKGELLATSGSDGRATLRGLNRNQFYAFLVRAHGFGTELALTPHDTDTHWKVALGPRYVHGTIRGDLALLKQGKDHSGPIITSSMMLFIPGESSSCGVGADETPVSVSEGVGSFTIEDLRAGELCINAGPEQIRIPVSEPVENLEITVGAVRKKAKRTLVIDLPEPEGAPAAEGIVTIRLLNNQTQADSDKRTVDVVEGRAQTSIPVPARVMIYADGLPGYIPKPLAKEDKEKVSLGWEIPEGTEPFVITLPLDRAGAIYGKVLRSDGSPASNAHINVLTSQSGEAPQWPYDYLSPNVTDLNCNQQGEFALLPLPLNMTFDVFASLDFARDEKQFKLAAWKPIAREQFQLPQGTDATVRVLKPDGSPAQETPLVIETASAGYSGLRTDSEGLFVLHGVNPRQEWWVSVDSDVSFQHTRVKLSMDGNETVIRLVDGLRVEGVMLVSGTDAPVPNRPISALARSDSGLPQQPRYEVKTITDHEGKFRFTNLAPGAYTINAEPIRNISDDATEQARTFTAGQKEPVVIHVRPANPPVFATH